MGHMAKAIQILLGSQVLRRVQDLSAQQKYVLIALSKLAGDTEVRRQVTMTRGGEVARDFFKKHKLGAGASGLRFEDFVEQVDALEANGLVQLGPKGGSTNSK